MAEKPQPTFRLPRNDEHTVIVGRNGCGKTQLGCFLLGKQDLKRDRWVALDFKGDELIESLENAKWLETNKIPDAPGLYVKGFSRASPEEIDDFIWGVWDKRDTGLYIDEGYMVPQGEQGAFKGLLTTGRSRRTPVIVLSQRPVRISRFAFSEASHVAVFDLNDRRDWATLDSVLPEGFSEWVPRPFVGDKLPDYHARWYSVKNNGRYVLRPVPDAETIAAAIDNQLTPRRRWL